MVTTCPQCGTVFRVTPEQLNARQGDVRCGRCSHVFNAFESLATPPAPDTISLPPDLPEPTTVSPGATHDTSPTRPETDIPPFPDVEEIIVEAPQEVPPDSWAEQRPDAAAGRPAGRTLPVIEPMPDDAPDVSPQLDAALFPESTGRRTDAPAFTPAPEYEAKGDERPSPRRRSTQRIEQDDEPIAEDVPSLDDVPGIRARSRVPFWLAVLACVIGGLALAAQSFWYFRADLAAVSPGARQMVVSLCEFAGCRVSLPHDPDLIHIESSELQADPARPEQVTLVALLRNRASYPMAYPHLELTLTDADDQPVARRILPPATYVPSRQKREEGIAAQDEWVVKLPFTLHDENAVGYRLYLFYPRSE